MSSEQTVVIGGSQTDVTVVVNAIDSTGSHVALVVDTTTTRLDGYSAVPTVTSVGTGIAKIVFQNIASLNEGETLVCKVNGTAGGTAFSEYGIPVKVVADNTERATAVWNHDLSTGFMYPTYTTGYKLYTTHSNALDATDVRTAVGLSAANLDTQLGDIPTTSEFNARTLLAADYFDASTDQVIASNMRGTDGANTVAPANSDISAIKSKTDQLAFTVANQVDANALSGGGSGGLDAAGVRSAIGLSSANLDTQLGNIPTVSEFEARTLIAASYFDPSSDQVTVATNNDKSGYSLATAPPTASEVYAEFTSGSNGDAFKADVSGLSTFDASTDQVVASNMRGTDGANTVAPANSDVSAIKAKTDQFVFTVANQVDANSLSGGGSAGLDAAGVRSAIGLSSANLDTQLGNIPTVSELEARTLISADYFDPQADVVANVTTTGSVTNPVETDAASRNASKADVSGLSTFDSSTDQVVASNMRGTDNGLLAADAPSNFGSLGINASGHVARVAVVDTTTSNTDMVDVSGLASSSDLATVDSNVDAIKAKTDELSFTVANQVDANALTGGGTPIGSGAISHTITVNVGGSPADGVEVWVSTDSSGNNVVAGTLVTDAFGNATFMLDAGSYYLWAQRAGTNFNNPAAFSVS